MMVRAIYENGVFRPTEPVRLPEHTEVDVRLPDDAVSENQEAILSILRTSFPSGQRDVSERHDEHQP